MSKEEKKCKNCAHYKQDRFDASQGSCRINPPLMFPASAGHGRVDFVSTWPACKEDDRCSKHEPIDTTPEIQ